MKNLYFIIMFLFSSNLLFAGFWNKLEKVTNKMEDIGEKKDKVYNVPDTADRVTKREQGYIKKQRNKEARREQEEGQRKIMENQMCSQYDYAHSPDMKKAYKGNEKMRQNMIKQTELSIDQFNIQYKRKFRKKFNYKKNCK